MSATGKLAEHLRGPLLVVFVQSAFPLDTGQTALAQIARESVCLMAIKGG